MVTHDPEGHNANAPSRAELSLAGRHFSHLSWALTKDRSERTRPAREAMVQKFLDQTKTPECPEGDPVRAESLRKAWYAELALKSAQARRANRARRLAGGTA